MKREMVTKEIVGNEVENVSNEWDWNEKKDQENQEQIEEEMTASQAAPVENETVEGETPSGEETVSGEEDVEELGQQEGNLQQEASSENGTYHWVNPNLQKNQEQTESNSYENDSYREQIGGGYRGGAYHDWQNQNSQYEQNNPYGAQNQNQQYNQNGQRHYGRYAWGEDQNQKAPQPPRIQKPKKPMGTGKKFLVTAGMAVVFGVIAGGVMFGVNTLAKHLTGQDTKVESHVQLPMTETPKTEEAEEKTSISANTSEGYTVAEVADACMPSVVSITNASVSTVRDFFGGIQEYPIESSGSGIIVGQNDTELLIATNNHVVDGAKTLSVAFNDASVCEAQTKGTDPQNDLAVIAVKLEDMSEETLGAIKIVSIGNSDTLLIGEQVVAIGNALGYGQSVTSGWVSAKDRELTDENGETIGKLIQTDAAINPGNSGGALLNMKGELIGINVAKANATEVEGMGYAIPVSTATPILDELMNRETRYKTDEKHAAYIGVTCLNVDASAVQMYGIPKGAFIDSVEEGGPAEAAGLQKGDVITKFDGLSISSSTELVERLTYYKAGEEIEIGFSRADGGEYKEQTVTVTLGKRSEMKQSVER